jgi:CelD/BcsL family acetyltransferase involved in cellulose biosynthesis
MVSGSDKVTVIGPELSKFRQDDPIGVQVDVFDTFEEASFLQKEWDEFMESIKAEIFLTYDWCRVWWKYYGSGRKLMIYVFRNSGQIVGILPIFWERVWLGPISARVVKLVSTDFAPVTISFPVAYEYIEKVVAIFIENLKPQSEWDILYIGAISGKDDSTEKLYQACRSSLTKGYEVKMSAGGTQIYIPVQNDWEAQVASLSKNQRTNVRRAFRDIKSKNVVVTSKLTSKDDGFGLFEEFVQMHQAQWKKRGKPGHFKAWPFAFDFHRELAQVQEKRDRLRLLQVYFNDACVAYEYIYKLGDQYCWFLNGRVKDLNDSRIDFKWISLRAVVELALSDGVTSIDAMRGAYEYKASMGGNTLPIKDIFIYSSKMQRLIRVKLFKAVAWVIDIGYSKVWRSRIGPRIGIKPGTFWRAWLKSQCI